MKIKNQREFKIILGSLYVIAAIFIITYIIALSVKLDPTSASTAGSIGDTIGGLASPFIGTMGVILTFLAFWVQFEANQSQREDIKRERFENKFYELLRLHKENVNEMNLFHNRYNGRSVFIKIYTEFRMTYLVFHNGLKAYGFYNKLNIINREELLISASYEMVFLGRDHFDFHRYPILFPDVNIVQRVNKLFNDHLAVYENSFEGNGRSIDKMLESPFVLTIGKDGKSYRHKTPYRPFDGHLSRLGHYFRHIYQILKFIDHNDTISNDEKYEYAKIFRAQLSTHEQAIIYFNSFWGPGRKMWHDKNNKSESHFILDFKIIKNLPFHLTDYTISPKDKYKKELKIAMPNMSLQWYNEKISQAFEELES